MEISSLPHSSAHVRMRTLVTSSRKVLPQFLALDRNRHKRVLGKSQTLYLRMRIALHHPCCSMRLHKSAACLSISTCLTITYLRMRIALHHPFFSMRRQIGSLFVHFCLPVDPTVPSARQTMPPTRKKQSKKGGESGTTARCRVAPQAISQRSRSRLHVGVPGVK